MQTDLSENTVNDPISSDRKSRSGCLTVFVVTVILIGIIAFFVRPGVFTIQPIGSIPDGVTLIYHSRGPDMPFFASPDGLCLKIQGSVSLLCRAAALASANDLVDRVILRLPYIHSAYLLSTDGLEFDR